MKKLFPLIFIVFLVNLASAQTTVDSLLQLSTNAGERKKADLYLEISNRLKNDTARSNEYALKAFQLATKNKDVRQQARAMFNLGENLYNSSDYQLAIPYYQNALTSYTFVKDTSSMVNCHKLIGLCYFYLDQGDKAISNFIEGMRICENDPKNMAKLLSNLAMTHTRMKNMNDAIFDYRKSLVINASIQNYEGMAVNYNGLGEIYKILNKPDSALANYRKAKNLNYKNEFQAITLSNMAGIYMNLPDSMGKAIECLKDSWSMFRKLGKLQYEAEFKQGIGLILYKQGKYKPAIVALNESIVLNDKFKRGFKIKTTSNNLLSKVYEKTGDYKTSLKHMKLYIQYADSMAQKEKYDQLATLEKRYETERKENQIAKLKAQQELTMVQLRKNKQLKQLGMTAAMLLLLLVLFVGQKYLDKMKSNRLLEEKNRQIEQSEQELRILNASKNKFFSIIAHDLKNPLHTVLGYSSLLKRDYERFNENERRKFASEIYQSTNNIFRLLQNLLEWAKSQTGRLNYSPAVVEYQRILDNSMSVLKSLALQKNIDINTGHNPDLKLYADPLMIETVLRNLINNAIKFTPDGGHINVDAREINGEIRISVSDTGIGMTEEETQNLFRIDSKVKRKGTNNEDGTGLGLILCHEFVHKHNGKIWVESTPGKGSEFVFSIPAKAIA